jgi:hypothetical protein
MLMRVSAALFHANDGHAAQAMRRARSSGSARRGHGQAHRGKARRRRAKRRAVESRCVGVTRIGLIVMRSAAATLRLARSMALSCCPAMDVHHFCRIFNDRANRDGVARVAAHCTISPRMTALRRRRDARTDPLCPSVSHCSRCLSKHNKN